MSTTPDQKAAIDAAMGEYQAAKAAAAAAKAKITEIVEAAGATLKEGEIRSLRGPVPVVVKKDGKAKYEILPGLEGA